MATTTISSIIDRADIHKSCKSLESVASILATYIETLNSLALINKKLAKALKETAGIKGTNVIPANALHTSACIFEALCEVDTKFVKIADKEVDALADDIKKWFKKLAKEEKAHDERLANASAKLKQAGQAYEKKSKRKDTDLSGEHSRYLAVLNTVGPEMTLDKQNHATFVTHRHTTLISHVAASVSRLAETEWGRACEHVRKFSPFIGGIGECRALCEGGWNGDLPADLPDETLPSDKTSVSTNQLLNAEQAVSSEQISSPPTPIVAAEPFSNATSLPQSPGRSRSNTLQVTNSTPTGESPHSPRPVLLSAPEREISKQFSLDASPLASPDQPAVRRASSPLFPASNLITEEPEPYEQSSGREPTRETGSEPDHRDPNKQSRVSDIHSVSPLTLSTNNETQKPQFSPSFLSSLSPGTPLGHIKEEVASKPRPLPLPSPKAIHRIDLDRMQSTDSLTNKVATMRDRYDLKLTDTALSQTPPRDPPRSSQRVAELAIRYTSPPLNIDNPLSSPTGLSHNDQFTTFQERYSRGHKFRGVNKPSPEHYRQGLDESPMVQENEVLRYSGATLQDRGKNFEEPLLMTRVQPTYFDEIGVRTSFDYPSGSLHDLRAREALLLERERRLEVEREMMLSAREAAPPYGRRYSDSPFNSHQTMQLFESQRPEMPTSEHHPSDCKCPRCSQLYPESNVSRQAGPIQSNHALSSSLRPIAERKRWRRMSTGPSAPLDLDHPGKNLGMSIGNISSPNIIHMSVPPEDFSTDHRRRSFDTKKNRPLYTKMDID